MLLTAPRRRKRLEWEASRPAKSWLGTCPDSFGSVKIDLRHASAVLSLVEAVDLLVADHARRRWRFEQK